MHRRSLILLACVAAMLCTASAAQAVVVVDNGVTAGVTLVPRSTLPAGVTPVTSTGTCADPTLPSDLVLPNTGLCYHGGGVMHENETFTLTWDPLRRYWQTTRDYLQTFLSDVAAGSGTLTSPYALTGQYTDAGGHAANLSIFGGGCIDYGNVGGSACQFGNTAGTDPGNDYPVNGCPVTGKTYTEANDTCVNDAQIQTEVKAMVSQTGVLGHTTSGATPLVIVLLPAGVRACVDQTGVLCSASTNLSSTGQFCSYHSQTDTGVSYVVQPWTPYTGCDEPKLPTLPDGPTPLQLSTDAGIRIASPLSQGHIASIVNPGLNGWYALDGSETSDNHGCGPVGYPYDKATVGTSAQNAYYLAREFNNSGVIQTDPNGPPCWLQASLAPTFVVPSAVNRGDEVQLDGSATVSTLIVPRSNYSWDFGDGTTAVGPSVVHSYAYGGTYAIKLTVTDLGGNVRSVTEPIVVLGPPAPPTGGGGGGTGTGGKPQTPGFQARLLLLPQALRSILRSGIKVVVNSNEAADGIAQLSIPRSAAKRAHIKVGRGASVVIGRGTVSGLAKGLTTVHLRMSRTMAAKLKRLRHVVVTIKLTLLAGAGQHLTIDAAGHY